MLDLERLGGTRVAEIVGGLDAVFADIETAQSCWKEASPFHCAEGCGSCCVHFEPDVLESEALYLAFWFLSNPDKAVRDRAEALLEGRFASPRSDPENGCLFFNPDDPYHCTVYGGRTLICRLFAYTGDRGKDGRPRWKPCKFLPLEGLDGGLERRVQYGEEELLARFGTVPPIMSDLTARVVGLDPDTAHVRRPLREALPGALSRVKMIMRFVTPQFDPERPNPDLPDPELPNPLAS